MIHDILCQNTDHEIRKDTSKNKITTNAVYSKLEAHSNGSVGPTSFQIENGVVNALTQSHQFKTFEENQHRLDDKAESEIRGSSGKFS